MVVAPKATPVTMPEVEPIVAFVRSLLLHVPPPASLKVVVKPIQTPDEPVIEEGIGLTVATVVVKQPVPAV